MNFANGAGASTTQYDAAFERKAWLLVGFTWIAYCLNYSDRQVIKGSLWCLVLTVLVGAALLVEPRRGLVESAMTGARTQGPELPGRHCTWLFRWYEI